jgi:hypothetical protein
MPIQTASQALENQSGGSPFGFKNRIINGAMVIDQRNNGGSVTGNDVRAVDRFASYAESGGAFTSQRSTDVPLGQGFTNSIVATVTTTDSPTGSDYYIIQQAIEGYNISDLDWGTNLAKSVTVSFWVKSSVVGLYTVALRNAGFNRAYRATYTINQANTWEYKTITVAGDTTGTWAKDNGVGIRLGFTLGAGANFIDAGNTWSALEDFAATGQTQWINNSGATFYLTGVQLEKGTSPSSFDFRPYGMELQLCQRYFEKFNVDIQGYTQPNKQIYHNITVVPKRATPTYSNGTASNADNLQGGNVSWTNAGGENSHFIALGACDNGNLNYGRVTLTGVTFNSEM